MKWIQDGKKRKANEMKEMTQEEGRKQTARIRKGERKSRKGRRKGNEEMGKITGKKRM